MSPWSTPPPRRFWLTSEIMAELRRLEKEVNTAMDELEQMLK